MQGNVLDRFISSSEARSYLREKQRHGAGERWQRLNISCSICSYIYTNKAKRNLFACNLFACLSGMAGHALYGMAPCFGHTGVTFDAENDRPGPVSL